VVLVRLPDSELEQAPRFWGQNAEGAFALNPGLAAAILPLRALGHTARWSTGAVALATAFPGVGSMNSFAVGGDTITLFGAADATRRPDAMAAVVARA
jgi:hypothetical protein